MAKAKYSKKKKTKSAIDQLMKPKGMGKPARTKKKSGESKWPFNGNVC